MNSPTIISKIGRQIARQFLISTAFSTRVISESKLNQKTNGSDDVAHLVTIDPQL